MVSIIDVVDAASATVKDARVTRGEAVVLALKPNIEVKDAILVIIKDFMKFMIRATGKMYTYHRESYSNAYRIQEPGRINFGIKISEDLGKIIIQPISILEDITLLKRYVQRIKRLADEGKII
jgi:hypothetical protein